MSFHFNTEWASQSSLCTHSGEFPTPQKIFLDIGTQKVQKHFRAGGIWKQWRLRNRRRAKYEELKLWGEFGIKRKEGEKPTEPEIILSLSNFDCKNAHKMCLTLQDGMDKELGLKRHDFNNIPIFMLQESIPALLDDIPPRGFKSSCSPFPVLGVSLNCRSHTEGCLLQVLARI